MMELNVNRNHIAAFTCNDAAATMKTTFNLKCTMLCIVASLFT